ncbi:MAG: type II CAAX endopeptidase family protein [Candidatus Korarchaeota archaeon]|nr:type II CAAX endopeptidase family protein [Candidatus Korarchaeota archaeon]
MASRPKHWRHALGLYLAHMATWTPYRYLTGVYVGPGVWLYLLDIPVKLAGIFGLTVLFARAFDGGGLSYLRLTRRGASRAAAVGVIGAAASWVVEEVLVPSAFSGWPGLSLVGLDWAWVAYAAYVLGVVGLSEEAMDRGYIYLELKRDLAGRRGAVIAAVVSAALFSVSHLPIDVFVHGLSPLEAAWHLYTVFGFGLLMCLYLEATDNLWGPVAMHSSWDLLVGTVLVGRASQAGWVEALIASTVGLAAGAVPAALTARVSHPSSNLNK